MFTLYPFILLPLENLTPQSYIEMGIWCGLPNAIEDKIA